MADTGYLETVQDIAADCRFQGRKYHFIKMIWKVFEFQGM